MHHQGRLRGTRSLSAVQCNCIVQRSLRIPPAGPRSLAPRIRRRAARRHSPASAVCAAARWVHSRASLVPGALDAFGEAGAGTEDSSCKPQYRVCSLE